MEIDSLSVQRAGDVLRAWALDEALKARVMARPAVAKQVGRIARRYTAYYGHTEPLFRW